MTIKSITEVEVLYTIKKNVEDKLGNVLTDIYEGSIWNFDKPIWDCIWSSVQHSTRLFVDETINEMNDV